MVPDFALSFFENGKGEGVAGLVFFKKSERQSVAAADQQGHSG